MNDAPTVVETAQTVTTTVAVLIGGGWAYFKFVRGRVFAPRAELTARASLFTGPEGTLVVGTVTLTNRGITRVRLEPDGKVVRVHAGTITDRTAVSPPAERYLGIARLFDRHSWVEGQETMAEEITFFVPAGDWVSLRVDAEVFASRRRWRRRGVRWAASVVVPGPGWQPAVETQQKR
ncbi:hypothetical protein [Herbidospora mongoliensis]|uniref:hypothetical protein n=1 Tax=Herbidospora mongoliensis TaxID=688067 RepID=UPI000829F941|nr:hypothetical protein [Herbidospora mongoliensis]